MFYLQPCCRYRRSLELVSLIFLLIYNLCYGRPLLLWGLILNHFSNVLTPLACLYMFGFAECLFSVYISLFLPSIVSLLSQDHFLIKARPSVSLWQWQISLFCKYSCVIMVTSYFILH